MREIERDLLQLLAEFPLADRLELASFTDWSERAVYQRLSDLKRAGLVEDLSHASELIRPTRRFLLTADGVAQLALNLGQSHEAVLRDYPVSVRWRQTLFRVGRTGAPAEPALVPLATARRRLRAARRA